MIFPHENFREKNFYARHKCRRVFIQHYVFISSNYPIFFINETLTQKFFQRNFQVLWNFYKYLFANVLFSYNLLFIHFQKSYSFKQIFKVIFDSEFKYLFIPLFLLDLNGNCLDKLEIFYLNSEFSIQKSSQNFLMALDQILSLFFPNFFHF